jgi:hypothetical protein
MNISAHSHIWEGGEQNKRRGEGDRQRHRQRNRPPGRDLVNLSTSVQAEKLVTNN